MLPHFRNIAGFLLRKGRTPPYFHPNFTGSVGTDRRR